MRAAQWVGKSSDRRQRIYLSAASVEQVLLLVLNTSQKGTMPCQILCVSSKWF
jgi:hypothetical protein